MKIRETGITLIALVVTIVVLLILAGVSISMLTGENGIITQAQQANIKNDNGTVLEALRLKLSQYLSENEGTYAKDKLELLRDDSIIDENNIVNVLELVEQKLDTGNGSNNKDVYIIEENHLYYYDKKGNKTDLWNLGEIDEIQIGTDTDLFEIDDYGIISVKDDISYYSGNKDWPIENVIIPSEIDGRKVVELDYGIFRVSKGNKDKGFNKIKTVTIPNTVEKISIGAFAFCKGLVSVTIPQSVTRIEYNAFEECNNLKTVYYEGTEQQWSQITIDSGNGCLINAEIKFNQ